MYGQSSSNGQWGSQGGYSRPQEQQSQGNNWGNQNFSSNTQAENWSNRSSGSGDNWHNTNRPRGTDDYQQPDMDIDNTFTGETNNFNSWPKSTTNRKRPLPMDDEDFGNTNYSRPRSGSYRSDRTNWTGSGLRSLTDRPPWAKSSNSSTGVGLLNRFPESEPGLDNWSKPNNFPKPLLDRPAFSDNWPNNDLPNAKHWENADNRNRFGQKPFMKFGRPFLARREGFKSKPKMKSSLVDVQSVMDSIVTTYYVNQEKVNMPKELTTKFEPLKCGLCGVIVNSTVTAKTHYSGKMHDKKVVQFMQKWCAEKGQPLPDQFKEGVSRKQSNQFEEVCALYCMVCDIPLTSKQHAEQHYMGKGHKRALEGGNSKKQIAGSGIKPDPTGRFHIGTGFVKASDPLGLKEVETPEVKNHSNPYICQICSVSTTSKEQLEVHLGGARHRKKVAGKTNPDGEKQNIPPPAAQGDTILETVIQRPKGVPRSEKQDGADEKKKDFSIFRTPSGQFYCATCNVTMNSESQFGQHNDSKRHKLSVANSKAKNSGTNSSGSTTGSTTSTALSTSASAVASITPIEPVVKTE